MKNKEKGTKVVHGIKRKTYKSILKGAVAMTGTKEYVEEDSDYGYGVCSRGSGRSTVVSVS